MMRLDKFLVATHTATRSEAKKMIKRGRVFINDKKATSSDIKIDENQDIVTLDGNIINYSRYEYIMFNKPAGVVSATKDNTCKTVMDIINSPNRNLFPVGRLDKDTEGLMLITDDGALAHNLLAPGKHVDKTYFVRVEGVVTFATADAFAKGVIIDEDYLTKPARLEIINSDDISEVRVTIHEGRFHQIKKMFLSQNMKVIYLKRLSMKNLILDENLEIGCFRKLTQSEIDNLKC
ncbi:MAG: rRNA pseudouridine synthase [Lachnospiraceae bacterium]|nr:rRNA pseudouridine synthase [Lachnospiraceae bacterium]